MFAKKFPFGLAAMAASITLGSAALSAGALAAEAGHAHTHTHPAGDAVQGVPLSPDGRKWATDEPLRQAMKGIRSAVAAALEDVNASKLPDAGYEALAAKINGEVNNIVRNCKLEPLADAQLHVIVGDLLQGARTLDGKTRQVSRRDGARQVLHALELYAERFDDAGWQPLKH